MIFKQIWQGRNCAKAPNEYFPASVPGNIQLDYANAHGFGDVMYADNYKQFLPLEDDAWEYRAVLSYDKKEGERVFFSGKGVDYKYDIAVNGQNVYSYEGMFKPFDIDITDSLTGKEDILTVYIYPHPKRADTFKGTRDEADRSCKPPVCYGWDWNPRLLISGIWQDAYIETRDSFYISDAEVLCSLNDDMTEGAVDFSFDCKEECETAIYDGEGNAVWQGKGGKAVIASPKLWWCNGQGEPYLYRWEIKNARMTKEGHIGFRKIRFVRNEGERGPSIFPKTRYTPAITIELNGRKILAKGSNWVNPDIFWGRIDEDYYDSLVSLVKDCNMNILRMWGGACMEKDEFYSLCDRYGIMVWQEFMLACNNYVGEEHYLSVLESEATSMLRQLRPHPSIAFWCGGNELFNHWSGMDDQSLPLRLLNKLCYEYHREAPFIAASPLMGMAHGGYMFFHKKQNGEVFNQFKVSHNTAYTEFGVPSISSVAALKKAIPEDQLFPPKPTDAWVAHHGFGAWEHDAWLCLSTLERYFGKPSSLESMVENSSWLQSIGYKGAFEEMRRQWPHCSMMLNWCFNEPWITAANNSIVEYPTNPKPAYWAVKDALRPKLFSAEVRKFSWKEGELFESDVWLLNDTPESISGSVSVSLKIGDTAVKLLDWSAEAAANRNTQGPTVRCVLPRVDADRLTLELTSEDGMSSSYTLQYQTSEAFDNKIKMMND